MPAIKDEAGQTRDHERRKQQGRGQVLRFGVRRVCHQRVRPQPPEQANRRPFGQTNHGSIWFRCKVLERIAELLACRAAAKADATRARTPWTCQGHPCARENGRDMQVGQVGQRVNEHQGDESKFSFRQEPYGDGEAEEQAIRQPAIAGDQQRDCHGKLIGEQEGKCQQRQFPSGRAHSEQQEPQDDAVLGNQVNRRQGNGLATVQGVH